MIETHYAKGLVGNNEALRFFLFIYLFFKDIECSSLWLFSIAACHIPDWRI